MAEGVEEAGAADAAAEEAPVAAAAAGLGAGFAAGFCKHQNLWPFLQQHTAAALQQTPIKFNAKWHRT